MGRKVSMDKMKITIKTEIEVEANANLQQLKKKVDSWLTINDMRLRGIMKQLVNEVKKEGG